MRLPDQGASAFVLQECRSPLVSESGGAIEMDFLGEHKLKLLLLVIVVILVGLHPAASKQIFSDLVSKIWPSANSGTTTESPTAETPSLAAATPASDSLVEMEAAVEAFMHRHASPQCTLSFLDWSDFSATGQTSAVTLRYRVRKPGIDDVFAQVRFTLQGGAISGTQVIQTGLQAAIIPPPQPAQIRASAAPVVIDHFTSPLLAAMNGPGLTLHLNDAFSLAQLDQAEATAQAQKKPLGFLMVWGQFFDKDPEDSRGQDSISALVHFYEGFNQGLVLVFVRHESELGLVPAAVHQGFGGPDEGGYAPNMAVTDATAKEFIVEIPYRDLDGPGRDPLFAAGAQKIDAWLATHPDAVPTPAPPASNP